MKEFLDIAGDVIALVLLLASGIGFLFRTSISEWIKHKFQVAVGRELEDHKHRLARELEGYKGSLMQELEEMRADIDIRRSIALRVADTKLASLQALAFELSRVIMEATTMATMEQKLRNQNMEEYGAAISASRDARRRADIFLSRELSAEVATVMSDAVQFAQECGDKNVVVKIDDPRLIAIVRSSGIVETKIRAELEAMGVTRLAKLLGGASPAAPQTSTGA
jgi:hypothetical protein